MESFFFVENGEVTKWDFKREADGVESIVAFARNWEEALEIADLYSKNLLQADNVIGPDGETYAAVSMLRDAR